VPKLGSFSGAETVSIMEGHGFRSVRQKGSHMIMQKRADDETTITVPVPLHKVVMIGTLQSIIRQSGIPKEAFFV
jgi:predicted RNA binding protein YcfA (HicA-like mRNA interferase family)